MAEFTQEQIEQIGKVKNPHAQENLALPPDPTKTVGGVIAHVKGQNGVSDELYIMIAGKRFKLTTTEV